MNQDHELLLPVGNLEMALAAIHNGADAIYVGAPGFNARGRTVDFSLTDLAHLIEISHLYGVKVNIALNILIFESELPEVVALLQQVLPLQPDAFIVQDLGLARLIRKLAPQQALHASTQMTVTNADAIEFLQDLNIRRFVLARENSLSEIRKIKEKTEKDLEVFVHGALCVSYSGQCFTSEGIGGRSANRGQCAQSCRFSYELIVDGQTRHLSLDREYLVSPQDLCGIREIPELMDIGVKSFKIEGRLKSPEYVGETCRDYRLAIDQHQAGGVLSKTELERRIGDMAVTYSRGFYSGWLEGVNHQKLVDGTFASHRGLHVGRITEVTPQGLQVDLEFETQIEPGDGLLWAQRQGGQSVLEGGKVFNCRKISSRRWLFQFSNQTKIKSDLVGAPVYLNSKNSLKNEHKKILTDKQLQRKVKVKLKVELALGEPLKAEMTDGFYVAKSQTVSSLSLAQNQPTQDEAIREELSALGGSVFKADAIEVVRLQKEDLFISHRELKVLRRTLTESLSEQRAKHKVDGSLNPIGNEIAGPLALEVLCEDTQVKTSAVKPRQVPLNILLREKGQVEDLLADHLRQPFDISALGFVILDFEFGRDFADSLALLQEQGFKTALATTRILKPGEYNNLKVLERLQPDAILVRNLGAFHFLKQQSSFSGKLLGDFSLNVSNHLTADYLLGKGFETLCLSYDLNHQQVSDLLQAGAAGSLEINIHQYMPSFHMEHCVFAAFLSQGTSFKDCGKPCERHRVELKDQFGHVHQIKADQECRNTMYNAKATTAANYVGSWSQMGLGSARFEALLERGPDLVFKIRKYLELLAGATTAAEILSSLQARESYGLEDSSFSRQGEYQDRKKSGTSRGVELAPGMTESRS